MAVVLFVCISAVNGSPGRRAYCQKGRGFPFQLELRRSKRHEQDQYKCVRMLHSISVNALNNTTPFQINRGTREKGTNGHYNNFGVWGGYIQQLECTQFPVCELIDVISNRNYWKLFCFTFKIIKNVNTLNLRCPEYCFQFNRLSKFLPLGGPIG